jgi:hypothetical protein
MRFMRAVLLWLARGECAGARCLTASTMSSQVVHRWYARPVLFVADVHRALRFYVDMLGFEKRWHEGDGAGKVCQVNRGECEIILCEELLFPLSR